MYATCGNWPPSKTEYLKDPKAWSREAGGGLSCIERGSFRLPGHAGGFGAPYDEGDPAFRWNLSFQVLRDDAAGQLVEVRYQDSRTDIDDALFRYEVVAGAIKPLESRVLTRGHFAMLVLGALGVLVVLCLGWIKSKQRVADHGEVFTPAWMVEAMLDLVKDETERIDSRFLEPACGSGNFLVQICGASWPPWNSSTANRTSSGGTMRCWR
jgi:hypothetical protein